jgi:hypothetical protein
MSEIKTAVPAGYADFLAEIKQRIQSPQLRASLAVNRELRSFIGASRPSPKLGWRK